KEPAVQSRNLAASAGRGRRRIRARARPGRFPSRRPCITEYGLAQHVIPRIRRLHANGRVRRAFERVVASGGVGTGRADVRRSRPVALSPLADCGRLGRARRRGSGDRGCKTHTGAHAHALCTSGWRKAHLSVGGMTAAPFSGLRRSPGRTAALEPRCVSASHRKVTLARQPIMWFISGARAGPACGALVRSRAADVCRTFLKRPPRKIRSTSMAAEPTELERIARTSHSSSGPTWASALGAVIVVMGVLLTASHATAWMKHSVLTSVAPSGEVPAPSCPKDELEEEGLTVAECEYMVSRLQGLLASTPAWFPGLVGALSALGTLVAFATIFIGAALVSFRAWAPRAAAIA